ncbi:C3H4 type zinc finger protein [Actinidia rufa]|uniref:C3H4 type zinc finger protein n=1 Tax=Actinidia rufa TaxID=165716 RepID=A0A7J0DTC0_9ERIC|nr:C3H4 type zinc finger protein [Actinidia rufa]
MAGSTQEPSQENSTDRYPLLMERQESNDNQDHFVDIERGCDASSSSSSYNGSPHHSTLPQHEDGPPSSVRIPIAQSPSPSSHGSESRSSPTARRGEGSGRPSLPILYWRYLHRNRGTEQASTQVHQGSSQGNTTSEPNSYITISLARTTEEENGQNTSSGPWSNQIMGAPNTRLSMPMDQLKMALDCFFAVWFVVGNVWIFGGHSSSADAPNLYRLCIMFLTFSCIGYAMPFILCSMICCCLPCIISILGVRDDMNGIRGATDETINALPTHKFKSKEKGNDSSVDSNSGIDEGGFVAAGTEKERVISGEDAVCCICLSRYADADELRELPCSHFFHTECVDKWLKINACCPLCKFEIGNGNENSPSAADSNQQV